MPRLSLLVPTYNRARWLTECLESLAATTVDCEILVSDNASTDETPEVLARFARDPRFRIIRQSTNIGGLANYDFLLTQARGEFICMFGDDDKALPGCFEAKLQVFAAHPELDLIYSLWQQIDEEGRDLGIARWPGLLMHSYVGGRDEFADLMVESYIMLQGVMFRRELYEAEGGFVSSLPLKASFDWQMLVRFVRGRRTGFLAAPTVAVRQHATSYTNSVATRQGHFVDDKLDIWRYWLLEHPEPLVLNERTWHLMGVSLRADVERAFGDDEAMHAQYQARLQALRQEYVAHCDRPVLAALGAPASGGPAPDVRPASRGIKFDSALLQLSGYSTLARACVVALARRGVPVQATTIGADNQVIQMLERDPEQAGLLESALSRQVQGGMEVCFHPPVLYDGTDFYRRYRENSPGFDAHVGLTMFETDRLPPGWAAACNGMDEVWVPSTFNRETFTRSGVHPAKLHVIPFGLDLDLYDPGRAVPLDLADRGGFTFLSVFQWTKRKGWDVLLKAYLSAFQAEDDVCLMLRTYPFGPGPSIIERLDAYIRELGYDPAHIPSIVLLDQFIPDDQMPSLYAAVDAFVLPTRGEGWGIPYMEAMAMGLPTLGTRWSAHLDFMNDENSYLIDVDCLAPMDPDQTAESPFYTPDQQWAEPSVEHTAALMRHVFTHREEAQAKGLAARAAIAADWSIERTAAWIEARAAQAVAARAVAPNAPAPQPAPDPGPPGTLLYHAPIYDPSGYADEARHFILGLEDLGVRVAARPIGRHSDTFQAQLEPRIREQLDRVLARQVSGNFIHLIHFPGGAFQRMPQPGYRIGRTMFETDGLPKEWVAACNLMDEIWVPSEFNRETFSRAGVTTKLVTMPGGVDTFRFRPGLKPRPLPGARGTVFLSVFEWSFRKGWDVLLQAWAKAFGPDADVTLVLRTYPINKTEGGQDMDAWVTMFLREGLKLERHQVAPILVVKDQVPDAEMPNLYAAANAYVAPSRGEGWGRPQMEAMACGLPVIATRWSGNMAFMTDDNALLLDIDGVVPIDSRAEMEIYHGQNWAEPSIDHLVTLLRRVAAEPEAMADLGARARADMERRWRWDKVAMIAAERLTAIAAELDASPPAPPPAPDSLPVQWEGTQLNFHSFAMVNRELSKRLIASGRIELAATSKELTEFKPTPDLVPVERALAHRLTRPPAVTVRHQWPPDFTPPATGAWVMVQPWEFGGLPDSWVHGMRHGPDEMWVYTHWLRDCYLKSGLPADRVHVVPLGVDVDRYKPEGPAFPLKTRKRFKFLFLGGAIPRKGVDVLMEAYLNTFTADDDVCLVIKGIGGETFYSNSPMIGMIRQLLDQSAGDPRMPEIEYLDASLSDEEVASMYRACDALVHPYRGEGFGLPVAEAMACGLPVIVTAEGACRDFCDEETAYLVPAIEVPLAMDELGPSRVGYWWAEPDRQALGGIMREVAANPEAAREVGRRGRARITEHFTWDRAAAVALARLEGLAGRPPVRLAPPDAFRPGLAPLPLDEHRRVVFFHHPNWGTDAWREVVAAYLRAFDADADATLALWLDPHSGVSADLAAEAIMEVVAESGLAPESVPDLLLVPDPLEADELARLYTAADWVVPGGDPVQAERAARVGKPVLQSLDVEAWRAALAE